MQRPQHISARVRLLAWILICVIFQPIWRRDPFQPLIVSIEAWLVNVGFVVACKNGTGQSDKTHQSTPLMGERSGQGFPGSYAVTKGFAQEVWIVFQLTEIVKR